MDAELRFSYFSPGFERITGIPPELAIGKTRPEFSSDSMDSEEWLDHFDDLEARRDFRNFRYTFLGPESIECVYEVNGSPIFDGDGKFLGYRGTCSDISALADTEKALRASENRLRDIVSTASDWVWEMDANLNFIYVSGRVFDIANMDPSKFVGRTRFEVAGEEIISLSPRLWEKHRQDLTSRRPFKNFTYPSSDRDGQRRYLQISGKPIFDEVGHFTGYLGTGTDVTEMVEAEERLTTLIAAIEQMPERIAIFDDEDRFLFTNQAYRDFNKDVFVTIQPGTKFEDHIRNVASKGGITEAVGREEAWINERMARHRNPTGPVETRRTGDIWSQIQEHALPNGTILWSSDISERKRMEEDLRGAKANAEQANNAKSEFLSAMSHELRTPMNAILGFTQLLKLGSPLDTKQADCVTHILNGGGHLLELIDQVLELHKIETGNTEFVRETVNVGELAKECLQFIEARAAENRIEVRNDTEQDTALFAHTDRTRLKQIILNLLSNAVKCNRADGEIVLACRRMPADVIRVSVTDTGIGIAANLQDDLFTPFERLGHERGNIEGTGIGLTITKRLVELLGAEIGFISEENAGSEFWVDLPPGDNGENIAEFIGFKVPSEQTMSPSSKAIAPVPSGRRTVLYIEDNAANLELMQMIIREEPGLELISAVDAYSGISRALESRPDLILMDINLPDISGIDAMEKLKEHRETAAIPVIAVSAAAMPHEIERALDAGFQTYLTKPINVNEVLDAIRRALA